MSERSLIIKKLAMVRASPIHPDQRRAAIIATTERLIVAHGGNVSTRAIAEAAGIAEGTIYRVFPTKEAIIDAIFEDAFNRDAYRREVGAVDLNADLRIRMIELVGILQRRIRRIMALFTAIGFRRPPSMHDPKIGVRRELSFVEIAAILEPDRDRLRLPPLEAARLLQAMVMALSNPMLSERTDAAPEEIVDLILNGIARHPAFPSSFERPSC
jgi:AcrR family transcriptional regulator